MKKTTKIRWVIAHEPLNLFLRAAEHFAKTINDQQSVEHIEVEIMTLTEFSQRYNNGVVVTKHDLLTLMEEEKIEMSQMYTTWLAEHFDPDMLVLDLPYLFTDHDHATRVLEGEVGEYLLDNVSKKSNVRGLSFTYSGGFRQMISNRKISTLAEMVGTKQRGNRNPIAQATLRSIGIEPFACEVEDVRENVLNGNCDGGETNYPRMYPLRQNEVTKSVIDTEHSLFLTSMIIADSFWEKLSPEVKSIIKKAAIEAGREERAETIRDGERAKQNLIKEGATVNPLSVEEKEWFKQKSKVVYEQFESMFAPGLIEKIQKG
jgi:TRAP-type C4-dicarboxylate transport system substrate-binding protein